MTPHKHATIFHNQYREVIVTTRLDLCVVCLQQPSITAEVPTRLSIQEVNHKFWYPKATCSFPVGAFAGAVCSEKYLYTVRLNQRPVSHVV